MAKKGSISTEKFPKTLLLGIYTPFNKMRDIDAYFEEFISLVKTLGLPTDNTLFIKLRAIDKANFLSKGKLQEVVDYCNNNNIEDVIISELLTPLQERNLADILHCKIFDRAQLILDIFHEAAHTAEGKTQVEIATLEHLKARLSGRGLELAQQEGFVGGRGPGETFKEVLRRYYANKIRQAKKELHVLERSRETQRKKRLESKIPLVSIVGYTNAGKSSILNRLTKSDVLAEDKLFATLDPTTRSFYIDKDRKILISDTVGFISELPPDLIAAFKATLDELKYSDLLLLVIDLSNKVWKDQVNVVQKILKDLNVTQPILYVFNKIDKITHIEESKTEIEKYQPQVLVHTLSKDGITSLEKYLKEYNFQNKQLV